MKLTQFGIGIIIGLLIVHMYIHHIDHPEQAQSAQSTQNCDRQQLDR